MSRPRKAQCYIGSRRELGARLKELRATTCGRTPGGRLRMEPLLSHVRTSPDNWHNWERGMAVPPEALLHLVARLNVSAEWLLSGLGPMFAGDEPPWVPRA